MKKLKKIVAGLLPVSVLLQPLGLISAARAETVEMEYIDPDHLHAPKVVNEVEYQYDANGNLVNDGERVIEWNQDNLPVKIEKDGEVVEFFYDVDGRRILKRSGQNETIYVNQYYQTPNTKYYFANGRIALSSSAPSPQLSFLHQDHLGSTVLLTDSNSQKLTDPLSYFPYGNFVNNPIIQSSNNPKYFFTGQEEDSESDLYNYNARLYNPTTGVFISADSVQGPNRYAYAANNPMMFTDPSGNQTTDPTDPELDLPGISATEVIGGETLQSSLGTPLILDGDWGDDDPSSRLERLWGLLPEMIEDVGPGVVQVGIGAETMYIVLRLAHYLTFVEDISPVDAQLIVNEFMAATGKTVELHFEMPEGISSTAGAMHDLTKGVHHIYLPKLKEYFLNHELGHAFWEKLGYTLKDFYTNIPKIRESEIAADKLAYDLARESGNMWAARAAFFKMWAHRFGLTYLNAWARTGTFIPWGPVVPFMIPPSSEMFDEWTCPGCGPVGL